MTNANLLWAAECALPVMFVRSECPDAPGVMGTCTALLFRNEYVFVTAAHVVARNDSETAVYIAMGFSESEVRCQIAQALKPRAAAPEIPDDLAVMRPTELPAFVGGESRAQSIPPYARVNQAPRGAAFAVVGYPLDAPDRNIVDYDARTLRFGKQVAVGKYDGPSTIKGLHTLKVSTAETWGPNGFSGGPAFRLLDDADTGILIPVFAGIVTNGGPDRIHFIDAACVIAALAVKAS
jgi:hypothetical protein